MNENDFKHDEINYMNEEIDDNYLDNDIPYNKDNYLNNNNNNNSYLLGNSVNFSVNDNDNEIKADMIVQPKKTVRIWGQIMDCNGNKIPCAYVKLLKVTPNGLIGVAHTLTDFEGFYQFDICACKNGNKYTVVVGKAATGCERVVSTGLTPKNCDCDDFKDCY
ncbi:hypothetical protein [Clostridium taeniosporum]|uniref:Uncharacterized protein n=1 Tax=Clostridium taeniosporum TaxID=394958 RepID=A0A1D7XLE3_9CLOT|nr:hypothetical protein [Clostridium taeniosporum]AOR24010.1 hypothetical protein BGI42_09830 [Clostridium taeniosporum]